MASLTKIRKHCSTCGCVIGNWREEPSCSKHRPENYWEIDPTHPSGFKGRGVGEKRYLANLKSLRTEKGYTIRSFCAALGVSYSTYYRWEARQMKAEESTQKRIAAVLGVRAEDLL